jgi:hypothetical protein
MFMEVVSVFILPSMSLYLINLFSVKYVQASEPLTIISSPLNPATSLYVDIEAIANRVLGRVKSATLYEDEKNVSNYDKKVMDTLISLERRSKDYTHSIEEYTARIVDNADIESLMSAMLANVRIHMLNIAEKEITPSINALDFINEVREKLLMLLDEDVSMKGEGEVDASVMAVASKATIEEDSAAAKQPKRRLGTTTRDLNVMRTIASKISSKLPSWTSTGDPCYDNNWVGVTCAYYWTSSNNVITKVDLNGRNLAGMIFNIFTKVACIVLMSFYCF